MKVSIITIVFNNREHIADCIKSVLEQKNAQIEYIVIDGGSNDGTQKVISSFEPYLAYYKSEKDSGLYNALNKGIAQATGDVIGILHSDDLFFSADTIFKVVSAFLVSNADLIYANGIYVDRDNTSKVKRVYPSKQFKHYYLYAGWIPLHTTIFVRKEIFQKYGLYDEQYSIASDYEISLRWFKNNSITKYFIDDYLVKMRIGGKSTSLRTQKQKSIEDYKIIKRMNLWGIITLLLKIVRKIPQHVPFLYGSKKRFNTAS